ncbi:PREDICTED: uncharacterized protein LOC108568199 [Nicrophorus vespilloides]|uniref:Uncharacterized protein LOC108568199 n=1 Tax=Nicrophorus vespilloides TaxID=110193 RepID=A0ABM1NCT0_NICVS|nr:PREDICTED: uncharacterized protein LOC108568199 [Nicrophorus vespilloides]
MAQTYFDILLSEQKKRPISKRNQIIRDAACSHGAKTKTLEDENLFPRSISTDEEGIIVKAVPAVVEINESEPNSLETKENSKEYLDSQSVVKECTPVINKPRNLSNLHQCNFKRWISNDLCSFDDTEFQGNSVDEITKSLSTSHQLNDNEIFDTNQQINNNAKSKPDRINLNENMYQKTILDDTNTIVPNTNYISIDLPSTSGLNFSQEKVVKEAPQLTSNGRSNSVQETPLFIRSPIKKANSLTVDSNNSISHNDKLGKEITLKSSNSPNWKAPQLETQNKKYERFVKSYSFNKNQIVHKQVESTDLKIDQVAKQAQETKSVNINEVNSAPNQINETDETTTSNSFNKDIDNLSLEYATDIFLTNTGIDFKNVMKLSETFQNRSDLKNEQAQETKSVDINEVNSAPNQFNETDETTSNSFNKDLNNLSLDYAADIFLTNTGIDFKNVMKLSETLQNRSTTVESSNQSDEEECNEDENHIWPNAQNRIAFYENMKQ